MLSGRTDFISKRVKYKGQNIEIISARDVGMHSQQALYRKDRELRCIGVMELPKELNDERISLKS